MTRGELATCLPRAGWYRVRIRSVTPIPSPRPVHIELVLAAVPPPPLPTLIRDRFPIRDSLPESLDGMHRLLQLLHIAGARIVPDIPLYLPALLGLELLVVVRRGPGPCGFPYAAVIGYAKPWRPGSHATPATTARARVDGHRAEASGARLGGASPDIAGRPS